MQPADEIPASVAAAVEGLVFDIDDTVTREGRLQREAFEALWAMAEAGLSLVAVTGRPLGWCDVIARHWPVDLAVGENGAGWVSVNDGPVLEGYFHGESERQDQSRRLERIRDLAATRMPEVRIADDQRARRCDLAFDVGERARLTQARIDALRRLIEAEGARVEVSSVHAHVVTGGWNKAAGVVRAADAVLHVDLAAGQPRLGRWCFIGDSANDEAAFAHFPLSVGVRNIEPHLDRLRSRPRYVTRSERGLGFAELARTLLQARGAARGDAPDRGHPPR